MRSFLRLTTLVASLLMTAWAVPGCSSNDTTGGMTEVGKVHVQDEGAKPSGKMGGAMDKGKMEGATDKGKMGGAMDKGKMEGATDKGKME
jgi:hypothetical protein